jgi:NAD(P)H dehydrogenase (quinone)
MKILIVYAHPNANSFNHFLKDKAIAFLKNAQHDVIVSDLYKNKFNPVASWEDFTLAPESFEQQYFMSQKTAYKQNALTQDIQLEIEKIIWADHIIFQFPLWWFSVPAILKGWFDRILVKGFSYDTGKTFSEAFLKGKTSSLIVTTQSPESAYQLNGVHQTTIETFLHPIQQTLKFVGIKPILPFIFYGAFNIDNDNNRINNIENSLEKHLSSLEELYLGSEIAQSVIEQ